MAPTARYYSNKKNDRSVLNNKVNNFSRQNEKWDKMCCWVDKQISKYAVLTSSRPARVVIPKGHVYVSKKQAPVDKLATSVL